MILAKSEETMARQNKRVAIIGGGMTGLALTHFLGQKGSRVSIIEKGGALSGLLGFTSINGIPIERFYHHFFTNDHYLLDLLYELGLDDHILWRDSASAVLYDGRLHPFVTPADFFRLPFLSLGEKIHGATAVARLRLQRPENIPPELTAERYLTKLFGTSGWQKMWRPLLVNKFGEYDSHRISAQWIAKRVQVRSGSERRGREVLGYINGSYHVLVDTLWQAIQKQGGRAVLNREVANLQRTPDGKYRINGEEYDVVVSTIAPDLIKKIVPELDMPAVTYRAAIAPIFHLRSQITPYYWINILDLNVPFSVIVNQQALLPAGYYHGLWPLYVGHYLPDSSELFKKSDGQLLEYYLGYLKSIFPGIEKEIVGYEIGRTTYAQPVVTAPWQPLPHTTNLPNFYTTSMAHIFPEDRGVNYAIREAARITSLLTKQSSASVTKKLS